MDALSVLGLFPGHHLSARSAGPRPHRGLADGASLGSHPHCPVALAVRARLTTLQRLRRLTHMTRYVRLFFAFARFGLATEMAFRANFLVKLLVEILWLGILLIFYWKLFENTSSIGGWSRSEYFFFVGCHYTLAGIVETFFLTNCVEFAELVRSGDLDTYLLKPIDEQFLISCRWIDWSTLPNIMQGIAIMIIALAVMGWTF